MSKTKILLNLAIEFGPIFTFIVLSEYIDFIAATKIFIVLTIIAVIIGYMDRRKIALFPAIISLIVIVAGLTTVKYKNPEFFIFETTFYNLLCAIAVVISLHLKKPIFKTLFDGTFTMTEKGWMVLTKRWGYMFVALAVSNEIVRYNFTAETWVRYKFFITIFSTVFGLYQYVSLRNLGNE